MDRNRYEDVQIVAIPPVELVGCDADGDVEVARCTPSRSRIPLPRHPHPIAIAHAGGYPDIDDLRSRLVTGATARRARQAGRRVAHIHLYILPAPAWEEKLAFRDALRADPALARAYAAEKWRVAEAVFA